MCTLARILSRAAGPLAAPDFTALASATDTMEATAGTAVMAAGAGAVAGVGAVGVGAGVGASVGAAGGVRDGVSGGAGRDTSATMIPPGITRTGAGPDMAMVTRAMASHTATRIIPAQT